MLAVASFDKPDSSEFYAASFLFGAPTGFGFNGRAEYETETISHSHYP